MGESFSVIENTASTIRTYAIGIDTMTVFVHHQNSEVAEQSEQQVSTEWQSRIPLN